MGCVAGVARGDVMTEEQLAKLRRRLAETRQPIDRQPWASYAHPRGWNDALDFVEKSIKEIMEEKP